MYVFCVSVFACVSVNQCMCVHMCMQIFLHDKLFILLSQTFVDKLFIYANIITKASVDQISSTAKHADNFI